ncbi:uncharacterized protein LOC112568911 [Pomacea canaliculata]|uniref:uncharacterized protein LOC112568911 n=1 Tax=Pomacea canaliculata TaxID=400727 RepID=UPI000D727654|nr:uncharacterized protein LOC112568911 [Pomacea canaliculata]
MTFKVWTVYFILLLSGCSALSIQQCTSGEKYINEQTTVHLRCGQCSDKIQWYVRGDNDQRDKYVGECTKVTCNVEDNSAFRLAANMRKKFYSSELDIINIQRRNPLHVSCWCYRFYTNLFYTKYYFEASASCKLITVPISIVHGSCSVQLSGWKVSGVCTVQWLDGQTTPTCKWSLKYKSGESGLHHLQGPTSSVQRGSTWYNTRNCTFEVDMPVDDGDYTYSVTVPSHPADRFSKTLRIEQPEVPQHNCPEMVLEGSSINCTCYTSKIGKPPAHIAWSESNNEHLAVENIYRGGSGALFTCKLLWGAISKETIYTVRVMNGPSGIDIRSYTRTSGDSTEIVLVCTAIDVYPSAVFVWNITCDNITDSSNTSTCTFTTTSEEAEMIVECTASNSVFENVSSSAIYVVHISGNKQSHDILIISGISATVVIVIGAVIFVCIINKWRVFSKRGTPTPVVHYTAPSGDLYTIAGTTIRNHGDNENMVICETIENRLSRTERIGFDQAWSKPDKRDERRKPLKPKRNPKPIRTEVNSANVTELSADSCVDVYHDLSWTTSGLTEPDTIKTTAAEIGNDEYNALHFHVNCSEHQQDDTDYSHLNL